MGIFEKFSEEKLLARKIYLVQLEKRKTDEDGKVSDGYISVKDYLT